MINLQTEFRFGTTLLHISLQIINIEYINLSTYVVTYIIYIYNSFAVKVFLSFIRFLVKLELKTTRGPKYSDKQVRFDSFTSIVKVLHLNRLIVL